MPPPDPASSSQRFPPAYASRASTPATAILAAPRGHKSPRANPPRRATSTCIANNRHRTAPHRHSKPKRIPQNTSSSPQSVPLSPPPPPHFQKSSAATPRSNPTPASDRDATPAHGCTSFPLRSEYASRAKSYAAFPNPSPTAALTEFDSDRAQSSAHPK